MIVFTITRPDGDVETLKTSRTKLTVGGAYTDDITLQDQSVSSEHGVFHITGEGVVYTDNGFGTLVNDKKIVGESIPITPEDSVVMGSVVITYVMLHDEVSPTIDLSPSQPTFTERASTPLPVPVRTAPGTTHTSKTYPGQTLPVPESTHFRGSSILKPASSRTSPPPGPTPVRSIYRSQRIETEKPEGQRVDIKTLANDFGEIIYIVILTIVFWPLGFFMTYSWWKASKKNIGDMAEKPAVAGCLQKLMIINVCILVIVLLAIAVLIITKTTR